MGHPNLSDRINAIIDNQISYAGMKLGEILEITAVDAETGAPGTFRVQVVHIDVDEKDGHKSLIFRFLTSDFSLYGPDRKSPAKVKKGEMAGGGMAATHVPTFVLSMIGFGGIDLGRDYSFEFVGGRDEFRFAARILKLESRGVPEDWRQPKTVIARYKARVRRIQRAEEKRRKEHTAFLKKALVVRTTNSTYRVTAADKDGKRRITKDGSDFDQNAKGVFARVGCVLSADIETQPGHWQTMSTSTVVAIETAS